MSESLENDWLHDAVKQFKDRLYGMEEKPIVLPHIDECVIEDGYDDLKRKSYIVMLYKTIRIVEFFDLPAEALQKRVVMSQVVGRCRGRLMIALQAEKRKQKKVE